MFEHSRMNFALVVLWILIGALQYGYHIAALNAVQLAITCAPLTNPASTLVPRLPHCIDISLNTFGFATSAFVLGGLASAVFAGRLCDSRGRRSVAVFAAAFVLAGSTLFSLSSNVTTLFLSRLLVGLGCGASSVVVPIYLSEVAPMEYRNSIGTLNQIAICTGIVLAQAVPLGRLGSSDWRMLPALSAGLALVQILCAVKMIESPKWSEGKGLLPPSPIVSRGFATSDEDEDEAEVEDPLLLPSAYSAAAVSTPLSMLEVLQSGDQTVRHGLQVVVTAQFFQQLGGINAVLYFSTAILASLIPGSTRTICLLVAIVNLVSLILPILLIERLGRRTLLVSSLLLMALCSFSLGYGINSHHGLISSISILAFVAAFSLGLGPIPFLLLDVPPLEVRMAAASLALGTNWFLNLLIGLFFLPLRDLLASGTGGTGNIFFGFGIISTIGAAVMSRLLR